MSKKLVHQERFRSMTNYPSSSFLTMRFVVLLAMVVGAPIGASAFSLLPNSNKGLLRITSSFSEGTSPSISNSRLFSSLDESAPSDSGMDIEKESEESSEQLNKERNILKQNLLSLCASYDRGFGASPSARKKVDELVEQLSEINPTSSNAALGVDGSDPNAPLKGNWRMVWTTALDVLNLGASPITSVGAIYQIIDPPIATNIIDLIPRVQNLLPTEFPSSLVRAEVKTRASLRANNSNRVGLSFEAVKLVPVEVLGIDISQSNVPIPPLSFNLPRINVEDLPGVDPATAPGYFDVKYLDDDMLIIQQNAPGGIFVSVKVDDYDP